MSFDDSSGILTYNTSSSLDINKALRASLIRLCTYRHDLEIVLLVIRGVSAHEQLLDGVIRTVGPMRGLEATEALTHHDSASTRP